MPKSTNQKDSIVQAALKLFAKHGYASTPISLIAKTANVSQGLMYNFFKSKEDLLKEMMALGFADIHASMTSYVQETDPNKAIEMHVLKTMAIIKQRKEFWKLLHTIRLQDKVVTSMRTSFQEVIGNVSQSFMKVFKKLGYKNPELEATLFLTQIDGLVILYLQDDTIPIDKLAKHLINRYNT